MNEPFVSLILVVRNEIDYIDKAMKSLLDQDYPNFELITVDGESNDGTYERLIEYQKTDNRVKVLVNKKRYLSAGWNMAIREAKGEIVQRIDGHSVVPKDFVKTSVEYLFKISDAAAVGGPITTIGEGFVGKLISFVFSHKFGVGNSRFRTESNWEGYVDTVPYAAYRKEVFEKVGLFDESLVRNEDIDLHSRVRKSGGKFYLTSKIRSFYFSRSTIKGMVRKSLGDGYWTMHVLRKDKCSLSIRHLVPIIFVSTFAASGLLTILNQSFGTIFYFLISLYFVSAIIASIDIAIKNGWRYFIFLPIIFFLLHFSRGLGSIRAVLSRDFYRKKVEAHG